MMSVERGLEPDRVGKTRGKVRRISRTTRHVRSVLRLLVSLCSIGVASHVLAAPNLTLTKTSVHGVRPGGAFAYRLVGKNIGPDAAIGTISLIDTLPSGVNFSNLTWEDQGQITAWSCSYNGIFRRVTCTRGGLDAGSEAPAITIEVTADDLPAGQQTFQVTNTAQITCSSCGESNTADNTGGVTTIVGNSDLSLQKSSDQGAPLIGAPYRYTINVVNDAVADSSEVVVTDVLPAGVAGLHAWGFGWGCSIAGQVGSGQTMTCTQAEGGEILAGTSLPITLEVLSHTQPGSVVVNQADVDSPADSTSGNNTGTATVAVQDTGSQYPDLAITNVASGPSQIPSGYAYNYVLTASNGSLVDELNTVTVKAVLPDITMTVMDVIAGNGWTCTQTNGDPIGLGDPVKKVSCTRQGLAAGETAPPITIKVLAGQPRTVLARAWVASTADTNTSNNVADAAKTVVGTAAPDLIIANTATPAFPEPVARGGQYTYALNVTDLGPGATMGTVAAFDVLPNGVGYVSAIGSGWSCGHSDGTVTCSRASSFSGVAPPIKITATAPNVPGTLTNHVFVTSSAGDQQPLNNAAESVMTAVVNAAPTAGNDTYSTPANQTLVVAAIDGVLYNDGDTDGDPLTAVQDTQPDDGQLIAFADDGGFTYAPAHDFVGVVTFTYHATDSAENSNDGTVTIVVGNQPLVIANQQFAVAEDHPVDPLTPIYTVTATDDGLLQPLTYTILSGNDDGAFALDASSGAITVAGPLDYETQPDYFMQVQVSDGALDATATVMIGITDAANGPGNENKTPTSVDDAIQVAPGGTADTLINGETSVLFNDGDLDGDFLTANLISDPLHGAVDVFADGTFLYTNTAGDPATLDEFTYEACDPAPACAPATVTVSITDGPLNRLPIVVDDAIVVAPGGTAQTLTGGASSVLTNDFDPDNDVLTFDPLGPPSHGAVTFSSDGSFVYTNNANDPAVTDSFTYQACDTHGACVAGIVTVTIDGNLENLLPYAVDDAIQVVPGGASSVLVGGASSVLANDGDFDGDQLTAKLLSAPSHGALTFDAGGAFYYENDPSDASSTDGFYYEACDIRGACVAAKVTITVTNGPLNHQPIAVGEAIQVTVAGTATVLVGGATSVLANDTDPDSEALIAKLLVHPSEGQLTLNESGAFTYAHAPMGAQIDSFTYEACDPHGACMAALVTITVDDGFAPDNVPEVVDDAIEVATGGTASVLVDGNTSVLDNDSDVDVGDTLTAMLLSAPEHGTLILGADGTFSYVNNDNDPSISDGFIYQACDSFGACDSGAVAITITPVNSNNNPPVIDQNQTFSIAEDKPAGTLVGTVQAHDDGLPQGSTLTYSITAGNVGGAFAIDATTGDITIDNALDYETRSGYILTVQVSDGDLATEAPVTITITDVVGGPGVENAPPIVVDDAIQVVPGGTATILIGGAGSVLANDSDPDGDALHAMLETPPNAGTLTLNPDGTFSYANTELPSPVSDSFEYLACDIHDVCTSGRVTIIITDAPTNELPNAADDAIEVAPGGAANELIDGSNSVLANDSDIDGDTLSATVISMPIHGVLTLNADGTFNYANDVTDPAPSDSFLYEACDTYGACDAAEVTIAISQALPVVNCILPTQVHEAGDSVLLDLSLLFTAPPGQGLSYSESGLPLSLSVDAGTGLLTGTLAAGDVAGSPYAGNLSAMTVPGGAMASESVNFVVLASNEIVLRNGFDGALATQPCQ